MLYYNCIGPSVWYLLSDLSIGPLCWCYCTIDHTNYNITRTRDMWAGSGTAGGSSCCHLLVIGNCLITIVYSWTTFISKHIKKNGQPELSEPPWPVILLLDQSVINSPVPEPTHMTPGGSRSSSGPEPYIWELCHWVYWRPQEAVKGDRFHDSSKLPRRPAVTLLTFVVESGSIHTPLWISNTRCQQVKC